MGVYDPTHDSIFDSVILHYQTSKFKDKDTLVNGMSIDFRISTINPITGAVDKSIPLHYPLGTYEVTARVYREGNETSNDSFSVDVVE